jgi:hypothetical protein
LLSDIFLVRPETPHHCLLDLRDERLDAVVELNRLSDALESDHADFFVSWANCALENLVHDDAAFARGKDLASVLERREHSFDADECFFFDLVGSESLDEGREHELEILARNGGYVYLLADVSQRFEGSHPDVRHLVVCRAAHG